MLILSNLLLFGCDLLYEDTDSIGETHNKTLKILKQYEQDSDPIAVQNWIFDDHGEANGHQIFITIAKWSFGEKERFVDLLESIPKDKRKEFIQRYAFAVEDSGAVSEFHKAFENIQTDLLTDVRSKIG